MSASRIPPPGDRPSLAEMAAGSNTGLVCPKCGCRDLLSSNKKPLRGTDTRYRYCRNCGHGVVTSERIVRDVVQQRPKGNISGTENRLLNVYRNTG